MVLQVMDLECEGKAGVGLSELTWIHTHKTAALLKVGRQARASELSSRLSRRWAALCVKGKLIVTEVVAVGVDQVSVAAGAVLAGASPEEVRACEKYAVDIGLAFQGESVSTPYPFIRSSVCHALLRVGRGLCSVEGGTLAWV